MGGLGKTALAKLVCHKAIERNLFDNKIWVCVSDNFNEQKILGEMLQTFNVYAGGVTNMGAILKELEKRWDDFKTRLESISKNNGNVVVVTTRSEEVASIVETSTNHRHAVNLLSDDEYVVRDEYGNIGKCKMYDLVHDLALSLLKYETLTLKNCSTSDDLSFAHHLYVDCQNAITSLAFPKGGSKKLRSLYMNGIVFDGS
ncbi:disease resistance RPP13-like protein 4 [Hevea brasiliensis]|uniref:disease resistance RPP13-like protein 4 n=1 Tax=Hevea brasiliensis TaxID=3981 RepID=UPI0025F3A2C3|nr:disease resistance RPP13-like protein 4 [Hevea brasiliensis]